MGSTSKRKGSTGERELLGILQHYGDAHRNEQRFIGGSGNPDIAFSCGRHRFHVEAKRVERLNLHAAIQQAERDAVEGFTPIVMHRRNREPWYATLLLSDFLSLLEAKHDGTGIQNP